MLHRLAHWLHWNTGTVVAEWRLVTIEHRPAYYAVAIGFQCSKCTLTSGWHLTKTTWPIDRPMSRHISCYPVHEL